ncbi:uncharacterized protein LOC124146394 [Haliotis rufescens]|uniref:uncharacterized protein LOC124146394 n=1 Tax=Haliotis rufescens TaxID=6454 RepID=UPI00201F666C|nr:uncharacterized protein LOC124146394 [Haliotis rufescens]
MTAPGHAQNTLTDSRDRVNFILCQLFFQTRHSNFRMCPILCLEPHARLFWITLLSGTTYKTVLDHGIGEDLHVENVDEIASHMEDTNLCDVSAEYSRMPAGIVSRLERSLSHHGFCGSQTLTSLYVNKCTQTFSEPVTSAGRQTLGNEIIYCNASTQTDESSTHSVGIQADKSTLTYENIRCSNESVIFTLECQIHQHLRLCLMKCRVMSRFTLTHLMVGGHML